MLSDIQRSLGSLLGVPELTARIRWRTQYCFLFSSTINVRSPEQGRSLLGCTAPRSGPSVFPRVADIGRVGGHHENAG